MCVSENKHKYENKIHFYFHIIMDNTHIVAMKLQNIDAAAVAAAASVARDIVAGKPFSRCHRSNEWQKHWVGVFC